MQSSDNPHLDECGNKYDHVKERPSSTLDHENGPKKEYYSRKKMGEVISVESNLFLCGLLRDMDFLNKYTDGEKTMKVMYADCGLANHLGLLVDLYPHLEFHVYDEKISEDVFQKSNVTPYFRIFGIDCCHRWRKENNLLFISNVWTVEDQRSVSFSEYEKIIQSDMKLQKDWYELLNPIAANLRLKLPYYFPEKHASIDSQQFMYLDGDIYLPIYGSHGETETRLFIEKKSYRNYNIQDYEQQMFYFNTVQRVKFYENDTDNFPHLDHCFDCQRMIDIVRKYCEISSREMDEVINMLRTSGTGSVLGKRRRE